MCVCRVLLAHLLFPMCMSCSLQALVLCILCNKFLTLSVCRILEAAECSQFTDTGFKALAEGCSELQRLDLEDCTMVCACVRVCVLAMVLYSVCGVLVLFFFCTHVFLILFLSCHHPLPPLLCPQITDNTLMYFSQLCPHLHSLVRSSYTHSTTHHITLHHTSYTTLCFTTLHITPHHTTLHYTAVPVHWQVLSHCERITDEGVRHLVGGLYALDDLRELELDNCPLVTDTSLELLW